MLKHVFRKIICCMCTAAILLSPVLPGLPGSGGNGESAEVYAATLPADARNHWAKSYINTAIDKGIVKGYSDGTFRPNNPVSRAEFSHMLNAALGNNSTASTSFRDVSGDAWYTADVKKAVAAGYASGYDDNSFKPSASITRQEAAVMLSRVIPVYNSGASLTKFKDASAVSSWATEPVSRAVGRGYLSGSEKGYLSPKGNLTRAEAVVLICKLLEKETIVKTATSVTANGTKLNDTIYSNGVNVSSSANGDTTIDNCVVLGNLNVNGGRSVTASNSRVANAMLQSSGTELIARGETSIKNATVGASNQLTSSNVSGKGIFAAGFESVSVGSNGDARLTGNFSRVSMDGNYSSASLNNAKVTALTVNSAANSANITVNSDSSINNATVNGPNASFKGNGTISVMAANANNITYEKKPSTMTTGKNVTQPPSQKAAGFAITPNPYDGATRINVDSKITLTFSSPAKLYNGNAITSSNISDFVQLRRNSASGTNVSYTASINNAKTVITITPKNDLLTNTKYYISIAQNKLKDADNKANPAFSSFFTTASTTNTSSSSTGDITFYPKDDATGVKVSVSPTIEFPGRVINYDNSTISSRDLDDIITFREDSSRGDDVDFSASINSAKTKITITPDDDLEEGTTYYLAINSRSLRLDSDKSVVSSYSVTWKTTGSGSSDDVTFYPAHKKTGVKATVNPTITFPEPIIRYSGSSAINSSYLEDHIELREGSSSGKTVSFDATINSRKTEITIEPTKSLKSGTRYYLSFDSKAFRTKDDEERIDGEEVYWTVSGSASSDEDFDVSKNTVTEKSATVTIEKSTKGTMYYVLSESSSKPSKSAVMDGEDRNGSVGKDRSGSFTSNSKKVTFSDLEADTSYYLYMVLEPNSGSTSAIESYTIKTSKPSVPLAQLSKIELSTGTLSPKFSASTYSYDVELPANFDKDTITVTATAANNGKISFNGSNTTTPDKDSFDVDVSSGKAKLEITVSGSGKTDKTYVINFTVERDLSLDTVTVNGDDVLNPKKAMTYSLKEGTEANIFIKTKDPDVTISDASNHQESTLKAFVVVDYGESKTYKFSVSLGSKKDEYTITIKNPNKEPEEKPDDEKPATSGGAIKEPASNNDSGSASTTKSAVTTPSAGKTDSAPAEESKPQQ